ncbi:MAG: alpha-glucan family phosphorylase [Anaerolineae bacterium]|nr:alpha-glucan family phosphorylase [Anaerolineae bacterium]MCB0250316.1 alpha-glucan family phosphorylase [Anaerolineae bacterium]MCB9130244.1 alpha-glucan family phosphorylase [Anaerolineales bacterium]MCB9142730.1 alpha-glucan family phosphorylase [Anaerolineales bacterium]MCO5243195.1 alpha-glucan family phosphorylase [Anaerolineae bacterium]
MNILGRLSVFPRIPEPLNRLNELAYNLWWSWNADAQALFADIDPDLWERIGHNPIKFLREASQTKLDAAASDADYLARYHQILARFDAYMNPGETWFSTNFPGESDQVIAYFSAEFGLHEALPIYSGGLGVLSGDHCKTASDLGLPFVGVGFLYPQGYFTQYINSEGWQEARYSKLSFSEVPATPAVGKDGKEVLVKCELPGRDVYAKVWKIQVGRIPLYLMDTDVPQNHPGDRELSARLYGGDQNLRISQEYVLGIGGVRAVRALGLQPVVWHMNEGHSAFLSLERLRELVEERKLDYGEALEVVRASTVFTTHTPVPAGHDVFSWDLMDRFFDGFWTKLGRTREEFLELARHDQTWGPGFSMTVLALHCAGRSNGVAALHGEVSREMWNWLWPGTPTDEVPIGHVTNGVHMQTWLGPDVDALLDRHMPADWRSRLSDPAVLNLVSGIPDDEFWQAHVAAKHRLVNFVRQRARQRSIRQGESPAVLEKIEKALDPDALILGFARRFATYKRATLIFHDMERFSRILMDPERPVQMVFSGKAHPADDSGKAYIQRIVQVASMPEFWDKIGFIEDYDMNVARYLVQGADVWLNNPRRPREASGTSGQKAAMNGNPNFSVLDGWWVEGYNGKNGWSIGEDRAYRDESVQDEADALSLYWTLEHEIIPLYFDRGADGIPHGWVAVAKEAMRSSLWAFSFRRMLQEYCEQLYVPTAVASTHAIADNFAAARTLAGWKTFIGEHWGEVAVAARGPNEAQTTIGDAVKVTAQVFLGNLKREDVLVEIVHGEQFSTVMSHPHDVRMTYVRTDADSVHHYEGEFEPGQTGAHVYGVRVLPHHAGMLNKHEMALVVWAA